MLTGLPLRRNGQFYFILSFHFRSLSEDGVCATYNMRMQTTARLQLDAAQFQAFKSLRVTDGMFMANAYRIVVATTARDLRT